MDRIRDLLRLIEEDRHEEFGYSKEENYHFKLLIDAGFVKPLGNSMLANGTIIINGTRLTWQGHEFLDNARNDTVWKKAKEKIRPLGTVSLGVVSELLTSLIKAQLKLP